MMGDLKDFYLGTPMPATDYAYITSQLQSSDQPSCTTTTSIHSFTVALSMLRSDGACTGCLEQAKLSMTNSKSFCSHMATTHTLLPLAYGNTTPVTYISPWLWMNLLCTTPADDANHLMDALWGHYKVTEDWGATRYCGLTFHWD